MAMKILGIDVTDKSTEEIGRIVDTLGIHKLSDESVRMLNTFPESMRRQWVENPESTGEFTDDSVSILRDSLVEQVESERDIDLDKIYSEKYAAVILAEDKKAYDLACGSFETSMDRQAAHYDNFYDGITASTLELSRAEVDFLCEQVAMGNYEHGRTDFFQNGKFKNSSFTREDIETVMKPRTSSAIEAQENAGREGENRTLLKKVLPASRDAEDFINGGKLIFTQPEGNVYDLGSYLQTRVKDIELAVGDDIGYEPPGKQSIYITPTEPVGLEGNKHKFVVAFANGIPAEFSDSVRKAVEDELAAIPQSAFDGNGTHVRCGSVQVEEYPLLEAEWKSAIETYGNNGQQQDMSATKGFQITPEMRAEMEHVQHVMDAGLDEDGYNADGFDENGHSRDGDYDPRYDKAYTDQGPNF